MAKLRRARPRHLPQVRSGPCAAAAPQAPASQPAPPQLIHPPPPPLHATAAPAQEPSSQESSIADVEAELALRGGFHPLMHLFPSEEQLPGLAVPYTPADARLRDWMRGSGAYQAAAAALGA